MKFTPQQLEVIASALEVYEDKIQNEHCETKEEFQEQQHTLLTVLAIRNIVGNSFLKY